MPVFNYSDYTNELRDIVCSNPIATSAAAANCAASDPVLTFPRIRNNSAYAMDVDSVRRTLESMAPNVVFGDLAVLQDRQFRPRDRYHADVLRRLKDDYRKWEVERIKKLISSKATIRYRIEVK
jgi:hypothetical protein